MTWAIDTNVLVYCHDGRYPDKRRAAVRLLDDGIASGRIRLPYQVLAEFGGVATRPLRPDGHRLFDAAGASQALVSLKSELTVLYPDATVLELATSGLQSYRLSWLDALIWAQCEHHGCHTLYTEDLAHGQRYGGVRIVNPFL